MIQLFFEECAAAVEEIRTAQLMWGKSGKINAPRAEARKSETSTCESVDATRKAVDATRKAECDKLRAELGKLKLEFGRVKAEFGKLKTEKNNMQQALNPIRTQQKRLILVVSELREQEKLLLDELPRLRAERDELATDIEQLKLEKSEERLPERAKKPVGDDFASPTVSVSLRASEGLEALERSEKRLRERLVRLTSVTAREKRRAEEHAANLAIMRELQAATPPSMLL